MTIHNISDKEIILREARKLTHRKGRWKLRDLEAVVQDTGLDRCLEVRCQPIQSLLEEGHMAQFKAGCETKFTTPVPEVTLRDLRDWAADQVKSSTGRVGARAKDGSRQVESITKSNLTNIQAMCTKVANHLDPTRDTDEVLDDVGGEHFIWNEADEEWTSFLTMVRDAAEASGVSDNTVNRYVGAARKLLDLAATHGMIGRTPKHDDDHELVPAAWAHLHNEWHEALTGEGLRGVSRSLLTLFKGCARLGKHPVEGDWDSIIEHLEDWLWENDVPGYRRWAVRRAYRALREKNLVSGPDWDGHDRQREAGITLLSRSAIKWVARHYGTGPEGTGQGLKAALDEKPFPWKGWEDYEEGLVSGTYGLRRALLYFTTTAGRAQLIDLPPRGTFPDEPIRQSNGDGNPWRVATCTGHLAKILHVAGWMSREFDEVDFSNDDLRTLLHQDRLEAYFTKAIADDDFTTAGSARTRATVLAQVASPYMEWVATQEEDEQLANRMQQVSKRLSSNVAVDGKPSWATLLKKEQKKSAQDTVARQRKKAHRIEKCWTQGKELADYAYIQLRRVLAHTVKAIEDDYGKLSAQIAAIQQGRTERFDRKWANRIRDALYWQDQIVVPLRAKEAGRVDLAERMHTRDFDRIYAEIPKDKMKESSNGDYRPNYTDGGSGYCRHLYRLYVMEGGARQMLRSTPSGKFKDVNAFYVYDVTRTDSKRIPPDILRQHVNRIVKNVAPKLDGLTFQDLKEGSALGTHFFRHAFATFIVRTHPQGLQIAARYLHHADTSMVEKVYAANSAENWDPADHLSQAVTEYSG